MLDCSNVPLALWQSCGVPAITEAWVFVGILSEVEGNGGKSRKNRDGTFGQ